MGDPAGTGPEIIAKAVSSNALQDIANVVCVGHAKLMENAFAVVQQPYSVRPIDQVEQAEFKPAILNVLHLENIDLDKLQPGKVQASAGHAAYEYITRAIELALEDNVAG